MCVCKVFRGTHKMSMFKYNFNGGDGMITDFNVNPGKLFYFK